PAAAPPCAPPSTWLPCQPFAATRRSEPSIADSATLAGRPKSPSSQPHISSLPSSTPFFGNEPRGKTLDREHSRFAVNPSRRLPAERVARAAGVGAAAQLAGLAVGDDRAHRAGQPDPVRPVRHLVAHALELGAGRLVDAALEIEP